MRRAPACRTALLVAWAALAVACSDSTAGKDGAAAGNPATSKPVDPSKLLLETDLDGADARAGLAFQVKCRTFEPAKAGSAEPYGAEIALPAEATVVVLGGPSAPLEVQGTQIKLRQVGSYQVACQVPKYGLQDPTPATLDVVPGVPDLIDTFVIGAPGTKPGGPPVEEVVAGTPTQIACYAMDKYGNAITEGFELNTTPAQTPPPAGLVLVPTQAGQWQIACKVEGVADTTPAPLLVKHGVPRHLFTLLDPTQIEAGQATKLDCVANDAWGNPVPNFPFALDHADTLKINGLYVSATKAGLHGIKCVPESLAWDLFVLHPATLQVVPGPPALLVLEPVPNKLVYKREEKVQFLSSVRDAFDNIIQTEVELSVTSPAKGFKIKATDLIQFNVDGTYVVHAQVKTSPDVGKDIELLVDGAPPKLTIDYPGWGSTLQGKPSVQLKGTAGDGEKGSGIKTFKVNGKPAYADAIGEWVSQHGASHGLNLIQAEVEDMGGEKSRATRGFYYSGQYYPTDAQTPKAAMVEDGLQVFLGKDFIDDGVHDPGKPDDLATIIEVALGAMDVNALIPGSVSQGDMEVKLSNIGFDKPTISLAPVDGGIQMQVTIANIKTDIDVKAKQKIGPIKVTLKAGGDVKIKKITIYTHVQMGVTNGQATVGVQQSKVDIDDMKVHVDGIAGLFDFLWNILLKTYTSEMEKQMVKLLNDQIPSVLQGLLQQFAINQTLPLPSPLPGGKDSSISIVSTLATLQFSPKGGLVKLDASFVAPKGQNHGQVLGAIGRAGCIGTVSDAFQIDETQRMQFAVHDDLINQALHAVWYGGTFKLDALPADQLLGSGGSEGFGGFSLEGAVFNVDLFLPPILETCNMPTPEDVRLQVGDAYAEAVLKLGDDDLVLGLFASLDIGAKIALVTTTAGTQQLSVLIDKAPTYMLELVNISKDFEEQKPAFESLIAKQLAAQLDKGVPGLDKLALDLPSLDLGSLLPGLPAGSKIGLKVKDLKRAGGYTAISAELN